MLHGIKIPRALTVRRYSARLIDINEYLVSFPMETFNDKIVVPYINETLIYSMPNSWSKQAYVQGFDCESITFKKAFNTFENMEIPSLFTKV